MQKPTPQQAIEIIELIKPSFAWMVQDIKHRTDQINVGHYAKELTEAIAVAEMLELVDTESPT